MYFIFKIFRLIKVLRFFRISKIANRMEQLFDSFSIWFRMTKFWLVLLLVGQICACVWHMSIDLEGCEIPDAEFPPSTAVICECDSGTNTSCHEWNWLQKYDSTLFRDGVSSARYLVSVYYSVVTLTTLGYGDVVPTNGAEQGVSTTFALLGAVAFSFLISNFEFLISRGNSVEAAIHAHVVALTDLCDIQGIPRMRYATARRSAKFTLNSAPHLVGDISLLPRIIQNELVDLISGDSLSRLPLFRDLDPNRDKHPDFRARLAAVLRPCRFAEDQQIYGALSFPDELYIVAHGVVEVLDLNGDPVGRCGVGGLVGAVEMFPELLTLPATASQGAGASVGAAAPPAAFRVWSARAWTRCELLELRRADLLGLVYNHLLYLYHAMRRYAEMHAEAADAAAAAANAAAALAELARRRCKPLQDLVVRDADIHRAIARGRDNGGGISLGRVGGSGVQVRVHPDPAHAHNTGRDGQCHAAVQSTYPRRALNREKVVTPMIQLPPLPSARPPRHQRRQQCCRCRRKQRR